MVSLKMVENWRTWYLNLRYLSFSMKNFAVLLLVTGIFARIDLLPNLSDDPWEEAREANENSILLSPNSGDRRLESGICPSRSVEDLEILLSKLGRDGSDGTEAFRLLDSVGNLLSLYFILGVPPASLNWFDIPQHNSARDIECFIYDLCKLITEHDHSLHGRGFQARAKSLSRIHYWLTFQILVVQIVPYWLLLDIYSPRCGGVEDMIVPWLMVI